MIERRNLATAVICAAIYGIKFITSVTPEINGKRTSRDHESMKRDRIDLITEILAAAKEPAKKTHLLFHTNMNYSQLLKYLALLVDLGLLEEVSQPFAGYVITEKGRKALELFDRTVAGASQLFEKGKYR